MVPRRIETEAYPARIDRGCRDEASHDPPPLQPSPCLPSGNRRIGDALPIAGRGVAAMLLSCTSGARADCRGAGRMPCAAAVGSAAQPAYAVVACWASGGDGLFMPSSRAALARRLCEMRRRLRSLITWGAHSTWNSLAFGSRLRCSRVILIEIRAGEALRQTNASRWQAEHVMLAPPAY